MRRALWSIAACAVLGSLTLVLLYREGYFRIQHPSRERFPVWGIDVSHHQGEVSWTALRDAGVAFAFIKATEGRDHHDSRFVENWREAAAAGIARGAYHFFTFCSPGRAQAEHFLRVVPRQTNGLPPVADVEFNGNCRSWKSIEHIRAELAIFLEEVEKATGRPPLLYVTQNSYDRILDGHFDGYRIWMRSVFWRPRLPDAHPWTFWQYANNGRLDGIDGLVDLNVYHGTPDEFASLVGGVVQSAGN